MAGARKPARRRMGRPGAAFDARAEILRGAAEAFGRGYAATSVEDICKAADVSRRTFYRFFRNKDEAFEALFEAAQRVVVHAVRAAVAETATPLAKVEAAVEAFLRAHAAAGPLATTLVLESLRPDSALATRRAGLVEAFARMIEDELADLGRARVDPLLVRALVAALQHVSIGLHTEGGPVTEARLRRGKRVMVRIFAASLAAPDDPVPPLPTRGRR